MRRGRYGRWLTLVEQLNRLKREIIQRLGMDRGRAVVSKTKRIQKNSRSHRVTTAV